MEADYSVELGADDESLEFPWAGIEGVRYYDLKRQPELLAKVQEAQGLPAWAGFLTAINRPATPFETAKCDSWVSTEINPEEEIFGAAVKFGSYVDLLFCDERRFSFPAHEQLVKRWSGLLRKAPEIPASAEFIIRRCYFHGETRDGFYITLYSFGYGEEEASATQQWEISVKLVETAFRQIMTESA